MSPTPFNVLRLGYREGRDPRITTHLALVSRALGATNFLLAGDEDKELFENIASVNDRFGGAMTCEHVEGCLLYTSPSPRDLSTSRMPSSA